MSLRTLSDSAVLDGFATLVRQTRQITAALIAHILEIEHRQLYRDAGCDSVRAFLIRMHHFSEDAAEKRLQVAHVVRRFPEILERIADGRLHLSAVLMLSGSMDEANAAELIESATHRTKSQIHAMLIARRSAAPARTTEQPEMALAAGGATGEEPAPGRVKDSSSPGPVVDEPSSARPRDERLTKIAIRQSTLARLRDAHDLVAGSVPFGDHDRVISQALDEFIAKRRKRKFATTSKPRPSRCSGGNPRTIPADVRRAVFARDAGRCTCIGPTGHRCESRAVEFDHIVPVARGGASTISNVRLLCRPHNQLAAERAFGRDFMDRRRSEAEAVDPDHRDLISGLRGLGYRPAETREAARFVMQAVSGSLEDRMRAALARLRPAKGVVTTRWEPPAAGTTGAGCPA